MGKRKRYNAVLVHVVWGLLIVSFGGADFRLAGETVGGSFSFRDVGFGVEYKCSIITVQQKRAIIERLSELMSWFRTV